jgi:hypothetical protein
MPKAPLYIPYTATTIHNIVFKYPAELIYHLYNYNIFPSTMQLIIVPFSSHNMFRPYTAIIRCLQFVKIVALYGTSNFSYHMWMRYLLT